MSFRQLFALVPGFALHKVHKTWDYFDAKAPA